MRAILFSALLSLTAATAQAIPVLHVSIEEVSPHSDAFEYKQWLMDGPTMLSAVHVVNGNYFIHNNGTSLMPTIWGTGPELQNSDSYLLVGANTATAEYNGVVYDHRFTLWQLPDGGMTALLLAMGFGLVAHLRNWSRGQSSPVGE
jgi:hypothetical protein